MRGWWKSKDFVGRVSAAPPDIKSAGSFKVLIPPFTENKKEKSPYFRTSSYLEYGGEGGIDSLRSPCGQPVRYALSLSNWLSPVVEPRSGILIPPQACNMRKKKPAFSCELFFKYGGEGGIDSLRSPCGQPVRYALSLSNWLSPVVEPRSGILIPPQACNMRKKSPHFHASSSLNMAVRGGFEPPIRCRIHTFQACSFSHSDTSPYCHPVVAGTGANVRKSRTAVNSLFQ